MKLIGTEQIERKPRKESKPKNVIHLNATLACQRCARKWTVANLNPERKAVKCPVCNMPNDIREAIKRAAVELARNMTIEELMAAPGETQDSEHSFTGVLEV